MKYIFIKTLLVHLIFTQKTDASGMSPKRREIYTFTAKQEQDNFITEFEDEITSGTGTSTTLGGGDVVVDSHEREGGQSEYEKVSEYMNLAVAGDHLDWNVLPASEMPTGSSGTDRITGHYTKIRVPVLYGEEEAARYGVGDREVFFEIYMRKYYWGHLDTTRPIRHVILVAGGPGEPGTAWLNRLNRLSKQYDRDNLIFHVSDHRGVHRSRDVVELISRETSATGRRGISWRRINRPQHLNERDWLRNVEEFEAKVGYPLVGMTCSNGARDLALISMVLKRHLTQPHDGAKFYLHAQSYGTQLSTRTLNILPNFYAAVLFEGLATMELVRESARADYGILSACAEDPACAQMYRTSSKTSVGGLVQLESVFDLKKLLAGMEQSSHNRRCRDRFLAGMRGAVYSATISFWSALHLSLYEMLADDFINPYTGTQGNFYPGMLVLPLIRDMYYCTDFGRFERQVEKFVEVLLTSVRGQEKSTKKKDSSEKINTLSRSDKITYKSINTSSNPFKSKPGVDDGSASNGSYFVQTYINAHEAFDMQGMQRSAESGYCDRPDQKNLLNQCPIWREQVRKIEKLRDLTKSFDGKKKRNRVRIVDKFEGKAKVKGDEEDEESSSDDEEEEGKAQYKSDMNKSHRKKSKKKNKSKKKKYKSVEYSFFKDIKWTRKVKDEEELNPLKSEVNQLKSEVNQLKSEVNPLKGHKTTTSTTSTTSSTTTSTSSSSHKRFYYDVDSLAYAVPKSDTTRIFVSMGTLDVKTPLLAARRLFSAMGAPGKRLFELPNVAHSPGPCRSEILRAFTAVGATRQTETLARVDECLQGIKRERKLDWGLEHVNGIDKNDWTGVR
jgi:pimeloyl-ACP methyl ester carboxylesterase